MNDILNKRCVLLTGKGGVGRSTLTAALALVAQKRHRRVLIAEVGEENEDYSPLAAHFGRQRLPPAPEEIAPGVLGVTLVARSGQEQFLRDLLHAGPFAKAALASETVRRLLNAAPGFKEMGIYYQLLHYLRARRGNGAPEYELILIDMPATGHTLTLTSLPEKLLKLVPRGPIAAALKEGMSYLNDPQQSAAWVITLPETLPVSECLELLEGLDRSKMPVGGILLNRVPVDPFTPGERRALQPMLERRNVFGAESFTRFEVCYREARRLRSSTTHAVHALPEGALPEHDLVLALADALESDAVNEALFGRPEASLRKVAS